MSIKGCACRLSGGCARLSDCHGAGGAGFTLQVELLFRGHGDFGASYGGSDIALVAPGHAVQMGQQRTDKPDPAGAALPAPVPRD